MTAYALATFIGGVLTGGGLVALGVIFRAELRTVAASVARRMLPLGPGRHGQRWRPGRRRRTVRRDGTSSAPRRHRAPSRRGRPVTAR